MSLGNTSAMAGIVLSGDYSAFTALEMRSQKRRPFSLPAIAYIQQAQAEVGIARVIGHRHDGINHVAILAIQPQAAFRAGRKVYLESRAGEAVFVCHNAEMLAL